MTTQTMIVTRGLPASGKSTWARQYVREHPDTVIVCRDNIRAMLLGGNSIDADHGYEEAPAGHEALVREIRNKAIVAAIRAGHDVIVGDTGLHPETIFGLQEIIKGLSKDFGMLVTMRFQDFLDVPLELCVERDSERPPETQVGEEQIRQLYKSWKESTAKSS